MNKQVVDKIKKIRKEKDLKPLDMAEKLNISLSTYNKLESGSSLSWAKYLEDILNVLDITVEDFFEGITSNYNITNKKGSFGGNIHVENLYADNKDKTNKIEQLYEKRLIDKDIIIEELKQTIAEKNKLIEILENKSKN